MHDLILTPLPLKLGQSRQYWKVEYEGEVLIPSSTDPEFAACRILKERGKTGKVRTRHRLSPHYAMVIPIEFGAQKATMEGSRATVRIGNYAPLDVTSIWGKPEDA